MADHPRSNLAVTV